MPLRLVPFASHHPAAPLLFMILLLLHSPAQHFLELLLELITVGECLECELNSALHLHDLLEQLADVSLHRLDRRALRRAPEPQAPEHKVAELQDVAPVGVQQSEELVRVAHVDLEVRHESPSLGQVDELDELLAADVPAAVRVVGAEDLLQAPRDTPLGVDASFDRVVVAESLVQAPRVMLHADARRDHDVHDDDDEEAHGRDEDQGVDPMDFQQRVEQSGPVAPSPHGSVKGNHRTPHGPEVAAHRRARCHVEAKPNGALGHGDRGDVQGQEQ
mmetsp:Transcript_40345/g.119615  ORF Transcript_40345/g.119615 Transcript_40345/m.119615 type:complete len:275 (+) Transcript_40345:405-1229(+)